MGGNTFNRRYFSDIEISNLIDRIDGLHSLFDNRVFGTMKQWRINISRHLDNDSSKRFYYEIEERKGLPRCEYCDSELNIESYSYTGYLSGFRRWCIRCLDEKVWYKIAETDEQRAARGKAISENKKKFYASEKGKMVAKENGEKISNALCKFFATSKGAAAKQKSSKHNSELMRQRILSGEFTPNSNNRNTHWESSCCGKKYRSSWEALYHYFYPEAEYEQLRLTYEIDSVTKIYIVDFIDHTRKVVCEVKPAELLDTPVMRCKLEALCEWGVNNGYRVDIFGLNEIIAHDEPADYDKFDINTQRKIRGIYGKIKNKINNQG